MAKARLATPDQTMKVGLGVADTVVASAVDLVVEDIAAQEVGAVHGDMAVHTTVLHTTAPLLQVHTTVLHTTVPLLQVFTTVHLNHLHLTEVPLMEVLIIAVDLTTAHTITTMALLVAVLEASAAEEVGVPGPAEASLAEEVASTPLFWQLTSGTNSTTSTPKEPTRLPPRTKTTLPMPTCSTPSQLS